MIKRFLIWTTLLLILTMGSMVSAQVRLGRLLGLSVTGNSTSESLVLKMSSGLREGEEIVWEDIQSAVKSLWSLGIFSDIRVKEDRRTAQGIFLTIEVEEYPRLERVDVNGNRKIKRDAIDKELGFFRGQVLDPAEVTKGRKSLMELYADKGYTLASIETKTEPSEKQGRAILTIEIEEGKKVQIEEIRFYGNTIFKDSKLRKQMKKTKENRWWRGADFDTEQFVTDKDLVLDFYRNNGYRDVEILKDSLFYDETREDMFIDIWLREGRLYYIGNVSFEGNELLDVEQLESLLEFQKGEVFSQEDFIKTMQENLGGAYYDRGHIYSQINPRETLRADTLDFHFIIDEGNPVTIRKIHVVGNSRTKDRVIRRELRIVPGDVFSKELLMRSHQELMMLNYFANVEPNVVPIDQEQMDLSFRVEEKSTDTANLSAGWSELDRLIGSVGLGMNNLFGNGQKLNLNWNFGRFYRSFNLGFTEPWFNNTPTTIGASLYDTKRDPFYIGYSQRSTGLSIHLGRRLAWPDNFFRGDWIYRLDKTLLGDFSEYYQELNPNNIVNEYAEGPLVSSGVTQIIMRNSLNHPEFPTAGSRVSLATEVAGGFMGGNVGYHKHTFKAEFFLPTFTNKLVLLARAQFGFMDVLSKSRRIPYLELFFMGGSGMSRAIPLRGYDDPLVGGRYYSEGGRTMFQVTAELRVPLLQNPTMFGVAFIEGGNTWLSLSETDPFDLRRSIGVGARIFMPMVGMIGFDYAYGFDNIDQYGNRTGEWKPQFVFGRGF